MPPKPKKGAKYVKCKEESLLKLLYWGKCTLLKPTLLNKASWVLAYRPNLYKKLNGFFIAISLNMRFCTCSLQFQSFLALLLPKAGQNIQCKQTATQSQSGKLFWFEHNTVMSHVYVFYSDVKWLLSFS